MSNLSVQRMEYQQPFQQQYFTSLQYSPVSPSKKEKEQIQDLRLKIENAKKMYQGFGKPGYLDKVSSQALRSVYQQKLDNRSPSNMQNAPQQGSKSYINSSFLANVTFGKGQQKKELLTINVHQPDSEQSSELKGKPENKIQKRNNNSNSDSKDDNEIEEEIQQVASLPHITEIEKSRRKERQEVSRRVSKELQRLEGMFPINYTSRQKISSPFESRTVQNQSSVYIDSEVAKPSPGQLTPFNQKVDLNLSSLPQEPKWKKYLDDDGDTSLSSMSDNPYAKLSEKDALYKIMKMHNDVLQNDKKRIQYLSNKGFVKGIFNDKSLHWEAQNSPHKGNNQQKIKLIESVMADDDEHRQKRLQNFISQSVSKSTNKMKSCRSSQSFFSQKRSPSTSLLAKREPASNKHSFVAHTPTFENQTPKGKMSSFRKQMDHFQSQNNLLVEKCSQIQSEFHRDRIRIQKSENKIRNVLKEAYHDQKKIFEAREKIIEADKFSQVLAKNNISLRNKIFRQTMEEINDQPVHDKIDKDIERFLFEGQDPSKPTINPKYNLMALKLKEHN